jgi:CRP-like cAMP-binding protein
MILTEEMTDIGFLRNLGEPYVSQVAAVARLEECPAGTVLFEKGGHSPFIYLVLTGKVGLAVEDASREPYEVCAVGPGELLGWSPIVGRPCMTATARTKTRCRLAVIDVSQIQRLCRQDPHFGMVFLGEIATVLAERLNVTRRRLAHTLQHGSPPAEMAEGSD